MLHSCLSSTSCTQKHVRLPVHSKSRPWLTIIPANRTLEDLDLYFRGNPGFNVMKDRDAVQTKRPQKFIQLEQEDMEKIAAEQSVGVEKVTTIKD
jgi:hypothetical protein